MQQWSIHFIFQYYWYCQQFQKLLLEYYFGKNIQVYSNNRKNRHAESRLVSALSPLYYYEFQGSWYKYISNSLLVDKAINEVVVPVRTQNNKGPVSQHGQQKAWSQGSIKWLSFAIFHLQMVCLFVCLFVCLEFSVPLENFSLIWIRHHCW